MATLKSTVTPKIAIALCLLLSGAALVSYGVAAQAQAPAAAATGPKLGTVKAVSGNTITLLTDAPASETITITVPDTAKVQQLAVGSTDIKTATPSQMSAIAVGDRVLSSVRPGDTPTSFTARQVIVMKSGDIAQKNAADQADWRKNGTGGIVSAVDPATGAITVTVGTKKVAVSTSSKTEFLRFTGDSVKFQDAKPGTLAQIQSGDQIQARGTKSADGSSVQADEVVSGSFKNLSGLIKTIDPASGKITLKDLASKKEYTVTVTANADIRKMPLQMATAFAARQNAGGAGGRGGAAAGGGDAGAGPGAGGAGAGGAGGGMRRPGGSAGADLSQMIARLPTGTLADLKNGDAVMIVASEPSPGSPTVTAITVLSGVEPILTANPNGGMNLSAWSMGGGGAAE
jgi:Cu/Ag efflux protein CusF